MKSEEIRKNIEDNPYYVQENHHTAIKNIIHLLDENQRLTEALKRIADLHERGTHDSGANEHRRIAAEALAAGPQID